MTRFEYTNREHLAQVLYIKPIEPTPAECDEVIYGGALIRRNCGVVTGIR